MVQRADIRKVDPVPPTGALPAPVGTLSEQIGTLLVRGGGVGRLDLPQDPFDTDAQLAWFQLNSLHFGGWAGVSDELEWAPEVVAARKAFEGWFTAALTPLVDQGPREPLAAVRKVLTADPEDVGPGVAAYLARHGTAPQVAESLVLRFPYQRIEADPHTFVVPRLSSATKRALCEVQAGEYGVGHRYSHAELYLAALAASGAPTRAEHIWPALPGVSFATLNLIALGSLNRSKRGVVLGQLALFEMDSVSPNAAMVATCDRLALPADVRRFFHVHVLADAEHEKQAEQAFLRQYPRCEPDQVHNMLFGIAAQSCIDRRLAAHAIGRWSSGRSALETPHTPAAAA